MDNIIAELQRIIVTYAASLQALSENEFSYKPLPGKWSKKELIGHLTDSAQNNIRRFVMAQYEHQPQIKYAQDNWVRIADYQNYPLQELIQLWVLLNKHIVQILKNIPAGIEKREVQTESLHSIEWLAADYNKHLLHHLHQVLELKPIAYP